MLGLLSAFHAYEELVLAFLVSLPRAYAFIAMSGIMNTAAVPRLARNAAILVISLPLVPVNMTNLSAIGEGLPAFAAFFAKEKAPWIA